jgi:hypothetical protein
MNRVRSVLPMAALAALTTLAHASAPERLLVYKVERIAPGAAPVIDGQLSEPVWQDKAAITALRNFLGPSVGELPSQRSEFTLLTDGAKLYIGATFHEQDMDAVRFNPAAEPFWNDCIELYFDPAHDGSQLIQLVVDCGGRKWWHKQYDKGYGWWDDSAWYVLANWEAAGARQAQSWTIEMMIDCKSFGLDSAPGRLCRFNACRFRIGSPQQEFSAWGFDTISRQKAMNTWGHLIFGAPGERMRGARVGPQEVAQVYPKLGDRVVAVATASGFETFSPQGQRSVSYTDLITEMVRKLGAQRLAATEAAVGPETADEKPRREELEAQATAFMQEAADEHPTLGEYDRLAERAAKLAEQYEALTWRARLRDLVARAHDGGD